MNLPFAWARLPGPADFLDTVLEDLTDRVAVILGLPEDIPAMDLRVEVADSVRHRGLGRWEAIRSADLTPDDLMGSTTKGNDTTNAVLWIEATDDDTVASSWIAHARLLGEFSGLDRICVVVNEICAEACIEDKRLRRRVWRDFVTALDSRALAQRFGRRAGHNPAHSQFRSTVIAELAGNDLVLAEKLCRQPLARILEDGAHPRERIWAAQVQVLLPMVEQERLRLLDTYQGIWKLPHERKDGSVVERLEDMEIGDMARQARLVGPDLEQKRLIWLRRIRNALAHNDVVAWGTLTSPVGIGILDIRG